MGAPLKKHALAKAQGPPAAFWGLCRPQVLHVHSRRQSSRGLVQGKARLGATGLGG